MPMFSTRRSRSMSVSRPTTPAATSPAMLAASQAFSNTPAGQKKLAQGAAAAALRTMSPTPTPVGQIQTKRMMERHSSVGAVSNDQRGRARPNNMLRRNSSSSMTERTFREPSPARPLSSSGLPAARQPQPPVPRLPETYTNIPPVPKKSQRRSMSIDDMQMRRINTASEPQLRNSARGQSNSRVVSNPALAAAAAAKKVTTGQAAPTLTRSDSNSSVNFSYPGRARPLSPPPQRQPRDSPRQEAPPARVPTSPVLTNAISQTEALAIQRDLVQASQQPVKKRKKRDGPLNEGSHFQAGSTGAKPTVHPLEPAPPILSDADDDYEPNRSRNRARITGQASHFPPSPTSPDYVQTSDSDSATDQVQARRALRASGALLKQPSVVREDWEGEQEDVYSSPVQPSPQPRIGSRRRQAPASGVLRNDETSATPSRAEQYQRDPVTTPQNLAAPAQRKPSLSPSRSTRFSNRLSSDMTQGQKHNPPPRSISPRKPALKNAASPHGLAVDQARDSSVSPSEGTDASYDGKPRTKKSAHVKFDNQPAVVGIAAEPDPQLVAESPQVVSPQYREQSRKWYALPKKPQGRLALSDDSDDEDTMAPRPELPGFRSVRNTRRNEVDTPTSQPTISPPSSTSSSLSSGTTPTTMNTSVSSDHAIGALLSRDQDQRKAANVAPRSQVWSAEVQQPTRIAEDPRARTNDRKPPMPVVTQPRAGFVDSNKTNGAPPSIAVQPATPSTEEPKHNDQWLVEVPGGFPSSHPVTSQPTQAQYVQTPESRSATRGEPTRQEYANHAQPEHTDRMVPIREEDSDHDSLYSDAAEEMSDGDGFGSIAAIVHSPVTSPGVHGPEFESPTRAVPQRNIEQETDGRDDAWENAGARWKGLAESAKRTSLQPSAPIVERSTQPSTPRYAPDPEVYSSPTSTESSSSSPYQNLSYHAVTTESDYEEQQPSLKKSMRATTPEITASNTLRNSKLSGSGDFAPKTMRNSMRNSGVVAPKGDAPRTMRSSARDAGVNAPREDPPRTMRSSMRDAAAAAAGPSVSREDGPKTMRASLRDTGASTKDDAPKSMRASMRDSATATRDQSPKVPHSAVPARTSSGANAAALLAAKKPPVTRATLQKKTPAPVAAPAPASRKALPPVRDDSDSESSFRKRRRAKGNDTGRYSMRRSMREDASPPPSNVDRRAIRSLSPVQRRPFSPVNDQPAMRSTMRGSVGSTDAPVTRSQDTAQRSSSLFGRRKDARSPTRLTSMRIGSAPRVAELEDERSSRPRAFRSRFSGSDDEGSDLRPVRGIPGKSKDDDSTDLEDSSDEEKPKKGSLLKKLSLTTQTAPGPVIERPASPTSQEARKKRSFFGRLRKSKDETANVDEAEEAEEAEHGSQEKVNGKRSANSAALGFRTDAEKEALIEETRRKLEAAKEPQEASPAIPQAVSQPEQGARRMEPQRHKSDSWPLVPEISPDADDRPYTADGPYAADSEVPRPALLQRNSSSGTPSSPGGSSLGKMGKKKRFPLLRKAFGLKD